jgi:predicted aspartyl protease
MVSRRGLLQRLGIVAAVAGGFWLLRETVLWPAPQVRFGGEDRSSGWLTIAGRSIPFVDATVQGVTFRALIDSGAQRSVIDQALAAQLGLEGGLTMPVIAVGVTGGARMGRSVRLDAALGELTLEGLTAAVLDLSPLNSAVAGSVGLVIGQDVLRHAVLDLDLAQRRLALRASGHAEAGEQAITVRDRDRALYVDLIVEGSPIEALVDTGSSSILALSAEAAGAAGLLGDGRSMRSNTSVTFGGISAGRELTAETITFAGRTFQHAPVQIYPTSRNSMVPPALLGVGALDGERVLIDLGAGRMSRVL